MSPSTNGGRPRINATALLGRPARQATLRESNFTLVAAHIFAAPGPILRSELVAASGLTRSTVSRIVEQLLAAAVIEEQRPVKDGRAGRPALPLVPATNSLVAVGLEVNTASLGGVALDLAGNVVAERIVHGDFIDSRPGPVLERVNGVAEELLDEIAEVGGRFVGAHLSLPGVVDPATGRLLLAPRLGWRDLAPADALGRCVATEPLRLGTVLTSAALAEASLRRDNARFLYVAGDNAIGAALVVDGHPFSSPHGWDGHIGHTTIDSTGPRCRCGVRGCLDAYVGRRSLLEAAGLPASTPIERVVDLARSGSHRRVTEVVAAAGEALGAALATFVSMVAVPTVVLGDNLALLLPLVGDRVRARLRSRLLTAQFGMPAVEAAVSGPHAAMIGGAANVLQDLLASPQGRVLR